MERQVQKGRLDSRKHGFRLVLRKQMFKAVCSKLAFPTAEVKPLPQFEIRGGLVRSTLARVGSAGYGSQNLD